MLSRERQRQILERLREVYPGDLCISPEAGESERDVAANLMYLEEHRLCIGRVQLSVDGYFSFGPSTITAAGIDFLADDGGLTAILDVVTVRLHADTIRALIDAKIEAAPIPAEQKSFLKRQLAAMSEAGLKVVTTELVKAGLEHLPDIAHRLGVLLGQ